MVTIHNLEVSFEIEGEGDEAVFSKLFHKYVTRWNRLETEMRAKQRRLEIERALVDRFSGEREQ